MSRIIIICEGQTEQVFCNTILNPHFAGKGIYIQSPLIKQTMGGITNWSNLKHQIESHLKEERTVFVSLLIDYYGLYENHDFPGWEESRHMIDKSERLSFLEQKMKDDLDSELRHRFIPHMQLHEFEGLLFNNMAVFRQQFTDEELVGIDELQTTLDNFSNPELINDTSQNAPSKRLKRIIKGYSKVVYGNMLAEAIGLSNIRNKCSRFNAWMNQIEDTCNK